MDDLDPGLGSGGPACGCTPLPELPEWLVALGAPPFPTHPTA